MTSSVELFCEPFLRPTIWPPGDKVFVDLESVQCHRTPFQIANV